LIQCRRAARSLGIRRVATVFQHQPIASRGGARPNPDSRPIAHGQNSHLENGRAIRYGDRMSISCAAVAPSRHPPGEAHSPPAASPLVTPRRWPARTTRRGQRVHRAPTDKFAPRTITSPCRPPTTFTATRQLQRTQRVATSVAKNTFRDRMAHATEFANLAGESNRRLSPRQMPRTPLPIPRRSDQMSPVSPICRLPSRSEPPRQ
jgi:hypothetical protein